MSGDSGQCCGGKCCAGAKPGIARRTFLKASATAAGALGIHDKARATTQEDLAAWNQTLLQPGERRVYSGAELQHIDFPLGGIGCGQVYLTGDGALDSWQILNNFNTEAHVPGAHFGLWARVNGKTEAVRLHATSLEGIASVPALRFSGEYPFAWIDYDLPQSLQGLKISLRAFTPMIPLNAKDSGLPAAFFTFTLSNNSPAPIEASVLATLPNLIGWDGYGQLQSLEHSEFQGNLNEMRSLGEGKEILLRTTAGSNHALSAQTTLITNQHAIGWHMRLCDKVSVKLTPRLESPEGETPVFWIGETPEPLASADLKRVFEVARSGGAVVISGAAGSLLRMLDTQREKGVELFEDWESGYDGWTIAGEAFAAAPSSGTEQNQQEVSGFRGAHLVNTYPGNDDLLGRALSRNFTIQKRYIHLLVGGGNQPGEAAVSLLIDGQHVLSATGENTEHLRPVVWDVQPYLGKEARIEITDQRTGGWGHLLVDDILVSDAPAPPYADPEIAALLREVLPFQARLSFSTKATSGSLRPGSGADADGDLRLKIAEHWHAKRLRLAKGAEVALRANDHTPLVIEAPLGKGQIIICLGAPETWSDGFGIKSVLGALLSHASGSAYTPQTGWREDMPQWGSLSLSTSATEATALPQWNDVQAMWKGFSAGGRFDAAPSSVDPSAPGHSWSTALAAPLTLAAGEKKSVSFVLAWHFPNRTRTQHYGWGPGPLEYDHRLGNQYNNHFKDASEVAQYIYRENERLTKTSEVFHESFYSTTLPRYLLDAVTANAAITRSPIYVWLEDGTVGGFEGTDSCCPMNCTHVYNYAMSLAHLWPALERNVRETDLLRQMHPEQHFIPHRTVLPLSLPRLGDRIGGPDHHALDGELSTLLKLYREWRLCGDHAWLDTVWPNAKKVMEHVLRDHDTGGDGVLKDLQANTYDTEIYGSNTFIGTLYLAALRAMEEMARTQGDAAFADTCRARFASGSKGYDAICWNGEFYINVFNSTVDDPGIYNQNNCYGPACFSDQLLGQWWAHLMGLGHLLAPERVRQTLQAIYKYNWRADLSDHHHNQRIFAEGQEKGLLVGSWPKGGRPERPILYCDEVWTGIEYHVAATMLHEGMVQEALQIIRGARDRYTGSQRNPWSEIECGGHYARAMSSYSLLLAASGFHYDAAKQELGLSPRLNQQDFTTYFSTGTGWGTLRHSQEGDLRTLTVKVLYGSMAVKRLLLPELASDAKAKLLRTAVDAMMEIHDGRWTITPKSPVDITASSEMRFEYAVKLLARKA